MRKLLFSAVALIALVAPSIAQSKPIFSNYEKYFGNYCNLKDRGPEAFRLTEYYGHCDSNSPSYSDMTISRHSLVHNTVIGGWRCEYLDKDITARKENPVLTIKARCGGGHPLDTKTTITIRKDDSKALINIYFDPPIPETLDR